MNFKNHLFPTTTSLISQCQSIAAEFDKQLDAGYTNKIFLNDIYKKKGAKCTADRDLLRSKFTCNSKNAKYPLKEIKGLYVLVEDNGTIATPFYVGISQTIIRRLKQHVFGKLNNHATLAYLMAKNEYQKLEGKEHTGTRIDLTYFDRHRERIQEKLRSSRVLIKEIDDNFLMHTAEVYLACHLKTKWNCFETH